MSSSDFDLLLQAFAYSGAVLLLVFKTYGVVDAGDTANVALSEKIADQEKASIESRTIELERREQNKRMNPPEH